jgi:PknH-like extracellular domain
MVPLGRWRTGIFTRAVSGELGLIAAIVVILAASAGITGYILRQPSTTSQPVTPVAVAALEGLLLSPDQLNTATGATGITVAKTETVMDDDSARVADKACRPQDGPLIAPVYAGSGWSAFREQVLHDSGDTSGNTWTHSVDQGVVLFSSAHDADAFFTASAQSWPACANRQYTSTVAGKPDRVWTVGPVANTNGTLSATKTVGGDSSGTWNWLSCQRALTVANNVVIDVSACSHNRSDSQSDSAVNIAHQIAAKVPTSQPSTTSQPVTPVAVDALGGLPLSPDQINTAMGATGITVNGTYSVIGVDDGSVADKACLPLAAPLQAGAYAGSGWSAVRGQVLREAGDSWAHRVVQGVVLFSSARDAGAFFTASAQRWPACANRQFPQKTGAGKPDQVWTVGPVSNTNGTLSATQTLNGGDSSLTWNWESCQRALTVANNVAIDVSACSQILSDSQSDAGVNIAHQIAAKVPT